MLADSANWHCDSSLGQQVVWWLRALLQVWGVSLRLVPQQLKYLAALMWKKVMGLDKSVEGK